MAMLGALAGDDWKRGW